MINKTVKDQNGKELTNADVDRILKGDHMDEVREKIKEILRDFYRREDIEDSTNQLMELIQAERTKAKEEAIKTIKKAFVDYHGYDFKKSIGLDGEDYQARIVCEDAINELKQSLVEKKGKDE